MKQLVTITRRADRHADIVARDYASSYQVSVTAGSLVFVLSQVAADLESLGVRLTEGAYEISVSDPYE